MIDSVLKGTGNSRFLKSAVPAGTSWADALAMLQAGTFPIDFNGINTDGFQQVGTPLNKANLLKDATAAQIGLPSSATPNDMFNVLAHAGDLHVWRKTVVTGSPVSAYFSLGDTIELTDPIIYLGDDSEASAYFEFSNKALTVRDNGTVDNNDDLFANVRFTRYVANDNKTFYPHNNASHEVYLSSFRGRYVRFYAISPYFNAPSSVEFGVWYYVPADATTDISRSSQTIRNNGIIISKLQKVIGHPYQPAGTTATYPVSTNRNAYQEGNDAEPAGYTLGEVVTGSFSLGTTNGTQTYTYESATSLDVGDDGTVSLQNPSSGSFGTMGGLSPGDNLSTIQTFILGKFVRCTGINTSYVSGAPDTKYPFNVVPSDIVYIPSNANVTKTSNVIYIDRYQPVTGYAAIPANTTIEYLGCLGDKARMQVVSYVGTGTYGSNHPNSLTFDFVPKVVIISSAPVQNSYVYIAIMVPDAGIYSVVMSTYLGYESRTPGGSGIVTKNNKTITFYSGDNTAQLNGSGIKYTAVAIG